MGGTSTLTNRKTFGRLSFGLCLVFLTGCASHDWAPGPDAKGTFEEAKAQCSIMARHSGGGFYAQGSPRFVAGAALGAAVGDAIRANADFNDCMAATGWVVADKDAGSTARAQAATDRTAAIRDNLNACIDAVRREPKYAPLLPHLIDNAAGHYSLTQMSDSRLPSLQEASLLASYGDEADRCRDSSLAEISAIDPRARQAAQRIRARVRDLDLALINRQITWGDYARRAQDAMDKPEGHPGAAMAGDDPSNQMDAQYASDANAQALLKYDAWHNNRDTRAADQ